MSKKFWKKALNILTGGASGAIEAITDSEKNAQEKVKEITRSVGTGGFGGSNGVLNTNASDSISEGLSGGVTDAINTMFDKNKTFKEKLSDISTTGASGAITGGISNFTPNNQTKNQLLQDVLTGGVTEVNNIPAVADKMHDGADAFNNTIVQRVTETIGNALNDTFNNGGDYSDTKASFNELSGGVDNAVGLDTGDGKTGLLKAIAQWLTGETRYKLQDKYSQLAEARQQEYEQQTYDRNRADALSDLAEQRAYDESIYNKYQSPEAQARQLEEAGLSRWALGQTTGVGETAGSSARVASPTNGASIATSAGAGPVGAEGVAMISKMLSESKLNKAQVQKITGETQEIGLRVDKNSWVNIQTRDLADANKGKILAETRSLYSGMYQKWLSFMEEKRQFDVTHKENTRQFDLTHKLNSDKIASEMGYTSSQKKILDFQVKHLKDSFDVEMMLKKANCTLTSANVIRTLYDCEKTYAETRLTEGKITEQNSKNISATAQAYADALDLLFMENNSEDIMSLKRFDLESQKWQKKLMSRKDKDIYYMFTQDPTLYTNFLFIDAFGSNTSWNDGLKSLFKGKINFAKQVMTGKPLFKPFKAILD